MKTKIRGWKEGILSEDLRSIGGTMHKKGSTVRYRRFRELDTETGFYTDNYEWHYLDTENYNLIRSHELLIEPNTQVKPIK